MITTIVAGLLIFTIIVMVHELGHFWAARRAGVHVEEFSIGMGPRLLHFTRKDTMYSIKLFPIGGSCRMLGDEEDGKIDPRALNAKPVGWRIMIFVGGAAMNFVLAFVIFTITAMFTSYADTTIQRFSATSPIAEAGVQIGDRIVRINNQNVNIYGDFALEMMRADGSPIDIVVERDGQRLDFTIVPHYLESESRFIVGFTPGMGIGPFFARTYVDADGYTAYWDNVAWVYRSGFFRSIRLGFDNMVFSVRATFFGLTRLITQGFNAGGLMGPIGIVTHVGGQVERDLQAAGGMAAFWSLMGFTALLSANLGLINLLPLPALDGGRLIFLLLEAVRRKPIPPDKEGIVHFAGFVLLMLLAVFVAYNDIVRLL